MEQKAWYLSKGIWTGIITAVIGAYLSLAPQFGWPNIPEFVFVILGAMGVYTRATVASTIKK